MERIYLIKDQYGYVLDVFMGSAKQVQRYVKEEYHEEGVQATLEKVRHLKFCLKNIKHDEIGNCLVREEA